MVSIILLIYFDTVICVMFRCLSIALFFILRKRRRRRKERNIGSPTHPLDLYLSLCPRVIWKRLYYDHHPMGHHHLLSLRILFTVQLLSTLKRFAFSAIKFEQSEADWNICVTAEASVCMREGEGWRHTARRTNIVKPSSTRCCRVRPTFPFTHD